MAYVFNCLYLVTLMLASPWLVWRSIRTGRYRAGWSEKFLGSVPERPGSGECIWLHAVSVGEVNLLRTVIAEIQSQFPHVEIVISVTTKTGIDLAKRLYPERTVFYAPLDFSWSVRRALARIRPSLIVLAELEVWPNWIRSARSANVPVAVLNGRLSEKSFHGYQRFRWLTRPIFSSLSLVSAQNSTYADRFAKCGVPLDRIYVSGSIKFDGANSDRRHPEVRRLRRLAGIYEGDAVFLAGSTQSLEEELVIDAWLAGRKKHPNVRLILVPRHPERCTEVAQLLTKRGISFARRSQLGANSQRESPAALLVDQVGELRWWWGVAQIGYVGGSLTARGGQNMIEPAAVGVATSFGPNTWNFRDVVDALLADSAAVVVHNRDELASFVAKCLDQPAWAENLGQRAAKIAHAGQGATSRTVALLATYLRNEQRPSTKAA